MWNQLLSMWWRGSIWWRDSSVKMSIHFPSRSKIFAGIARRQFLVFQLLWIHTCVFKHDVSCETILTKWSAHVNPKIQYLVFFINRALHFKHGQLLAYTLQCNNKSSHECIHFAHIMEFTHMGLIDDDDDDNDHFNRIHKKTVEYLICVCLKIVFFFGQLPLPSLPSMSA